MWQKAFSDPYLKCNDKTPIKNLNLHKTDIENNKILVDIL